MTAGRLFSTRMSARVAAGDERFVAGAAQHHTPHVAVIRHLAQRGFELSDRLGVERIVHLRPADGHPGNATFPVDEGGLG
jgi:hypothetical protein